MMLQRFLELVYPRKCILCGRFLGKEETDLCGKCRTDTPEYHYGTHKVRFCADVTAVWYYEKDVRSSILRYKFRNARSYAQPFGRLTAMRILRDLPQADAVTWVPVSARRLRERGYDQVELLARAAAEELELPCLGLLKKVRDNKPNSSLETAGERAANVLGAYAARNTEELKDKRIVLLDDIITTGATASECARVLRTAGAKEVYCAAIAAVRKSKK